MSDFLGSLIDRSMGVGSTLRPRLASRFEAMPTASTVPGIGLDDFQSRDDQPRPSFGAAETTRPAFERFAGRTPALELPNSGNAVTSLHPMGQTDSPRFEHPNSADSSSVREDANESRPLQFVQPDMTPFDPHRDRWLNDRLNGLASQLDQLRGERPDGRQTVITPLAQSSTAFPPVKSGRADGIDQVSALDRTRSRSDGVEETSPIRQSMFPSPVPAISVSSLVPQKRREPKDDLNSLYAESPLQPVPNIVPENLSTSSNQSSSVQPTINVTIGRVEVKAIRDAVPARQSKPRSSSSVMTLQDYLQRRAAGGSR